MIADLLSLPGVGGLAAAGFLYAGLSVAVVGPLVGERMIERSGWLAACERKLADAVPMTPTAPEAAGDCGALLGTLFGRDGAAFCHRNGPALAAAGRLAERLAPPVRGSDPRSACACAAHTVLGANRADFALHAGSLRFLTPRPVRDLGAELDRALAAPACRGRTP